MEDLEGLVTYWRVDFINGDGERETAITTLSKYLARDWFKGHSLAEKLGRGGIHNVRMYQFMEDENGEVVKKGMITS